MRREERPSWLGRVESGTRVAEAMGIGALKDGAVVVVAEVCTAVDIDVCACSRARVAFFFLFGCEESKGVSRPNDRPTADAPTTVAVAQSCVTRMRQSWHFRTTSMRGISR
jgi:hypothetical protein